MEIVKNNKYTKYQKDVIIDESYEFGKTDETDETYEIYDENDTNNIKINIIYIAIRERYNSRFDKLYDYDILGCYSSEEDAHNKIIQDENEQENAICHYGWDIKEILLNT